MRFSARTWVCLAAFSVALATATNAMAEEEVRLKLDMDHNVLGGVSDTFTLRPTIRTEQRFRDQGLVLLKVFVGVRADLRPWLMLQTYYAHKDKLSSGHDVIHMLVLDAILHYKFGPLKISDRNGNEWHSAPGFFRYRNNLDVHVNPGLDWLRLFVADEVRFDSDQARLNMNDLKVGMDLILSPQLTLRTYYDLESNRRSMDSWVNTHILQIGLIVRLGKAPALFGKGRHKITPEKFLAMENAVLLDVRTEGESARCASGRRVRAAKTCGQLS